MTAIKLHPKIATLLRRDYYNVRSFTTKQSQPKREAAVAEDVRTAYFCVWGEKDSYGTTWVKGAFAKSIRERGPSSAANQKIPVVWAHDISDPIGQPVSIVEDDYGAYMDYLLDDGEAVPSAKRAAAQLDSGTVNGWSFGFDFIYDKLEYVDETDTILVKEVDLFEISPTVMPAISGTHNVRSALTLEEYNGKMVNLRDELEETLRTLPRNKKLELRQLLSQIETLRETKPRPPKALLKKRTGYAALSALPEPVKNEKRFGKYKIDLDKF